MQTTKWSWIEQNRTTNMSTRSGVVFQPQQTNQTENSNEEERQEGQHFQGLLLRRLLRAQIDYDHGSAQVGWTGLP